MTPRCAVAGCKRPVPPVALRHGDGYCSRLHFQLANGFVSVEQALEEQKKQVATGATYKVQEGAV